MSDMEPLPIAAIEGLVPALLRVYALVHEISATPDFQRRENPTLPQELVDAVILSYSKLWKFVALMINLTG